jgi:glycosyltransferase involved in cell wall biosynthesis
MKPTDLTIITPCFNEEETVTACASAVRDLMASMLPGIKYEHIFADNCSTDGTIKLLEDIAKKDPKVKVIQNSRNIGALRNIYNAMKSASGNAVIPMLPADLQDPVEVIPEFYQEWLKGNLIVFGVRSIRIESFLMRILRGIHYRIISRFAEGDIPINAGEFMLVDKEIVATIVEVDDQYPYVRGLVARTGAKSSSVSYTWQPRTAGSSKANPLLLIDQAINALISTSKLPARFALVMGFILSLIGLGIAFVAIGISLFGGEKVSQGIPTLIVGLFLFGGVQLFFLGLIGEYVLSIHAQVRRTPRVVELKKINF